MRGGRPNSPTALQKLNYEKGITFLGENSLSLSLQVTYKHAFFPFPQHPQLVIVYRILLSNTYRFPRARKMAFRNPRSV